MWLEASKTQDRSQLGWIPTGSALGRKQAFANRRRRDRGRSPPGGPALLWEAGVDCSEQGIRAMHRIIRDPFLLVYPRVRQPEPSRRSFDSALTPPA